MLREDDLLGARTCEAFLACPRGRDCCHLSDEVDGVLAFLLKGKKLVLLLF